MELNGHLKLIQKFRTGHGTELGILKLIALSLYTEIPTSTERVYKNLETFL
jgi:hypothetical protein